MLARVVVGVSLGGLQVFGTWNGPPGKATLLSRPPTDIAIQQTTARAWAAPLAVLRPPRPCVDVARCACAVLSAQLEMHGNYNKPISTAGVANKHQAFRA